MNRATGISVGQGLGQQFTFPVAWKVVVQALEPALGVIQLVPWLVKVDAGCELGVTCKACPFPQVDRAVEIFDGVLDFDHPGQDQGVELTACDGRRGVLVA